MSTTSEQVSESTAAADAVAQAAAAQQATDDTAGGESAAGQDANQGADAGKSPMELAYERAEKRVADAKAAKQQNSSSASATTSSQAPGGKTPAGESSEDNADASKQSQQAAKDDPEADGQQRGGENTDTDDADSTVKAPDDWPQHVKEAFDALPTQEARKAMLGLHQDMNKGFHESMNKLAQLRKADEALFQTLDETGRTSQDVQRLVEYDQLFEKDPKQVLSRLAAQAGIEVYFDKPVAAGEIPEFKDPAEMAKWVQEQTLQAVEEDRKKQAAEVEQQTQREKAKAELQAELKAAGEKFKDFDQHKPAIFDKLAQVPGLSVEDAYFLTQRDNLLQLVEKGRKAETELAKLKQDLEKERKKSTQPPAGSGSGDATAEDKDLSPGERAFRRAERKRAAKANAGASAA